MQLISNCLTVTLTTVFIMPLLSAQMLAQQSSAALDSALLPEAPQPQFALARSLMEQTVDQQSNPETGGMGGTVSDAYGDVISGAVVTLDGPDREDHRQIEANDTGGFAFEGLRANVPYQITISAKGFVTWTSAKVILAPGQFLILKSAELKIEGEQTSIMVYGSTEQIAIEQVHIAEQQRVLGIIPNFYVVYDSKNAVPLTKKLKFKLALKVSTDPVTFGAVAFMAAINQAANTPDYVQGARGYGQRLGTVAADSFDDILIGGAVLPSLLHQDPRYFYQGTGTAKSRMKHAILHPFVCKGDNGHWQPNYSSVGGDLASSAISNTFYPQSNRGPGLIFGTFAIDTAQRALSAIAQEFILSRFTSKAKR